MLAGLLKDGPHIKEIGAAFSIIILGTQRPLKQNHVLTGTLLLVLTKH